MEMMIKFHQLCRRLDHFLIKNLALIVLLGLVIVLRLPNLYEPYWYGDEAIYLTIGQALRHGEKLYAQIVDHKTPLIYYLAMVPNQFYFRLLNISWMVGTTACFYYLAQKLITRKRLANLATLFFIILTTMPWLEGNIPNGELFMMGFVLVGGMIFFRSQKPEVKSEKIFYLPASSFWFLTSGFFFGLGLMTKVPALFDFAAFLSFGWFEFWQLKTIKLSSFIKFISTSLLLTVGFVLPLLISIGYFYLRGSLTDYLNFGLLYNFHYAANWQLSSSQLINLLFSLPIKIIIAGSILVLITILSRFLTLSVQFSASWLVLSLLAALLSNRPYPHYFLQIIPALSLLIFTTADSLFSRTRLKIINLWLSLTLLGLLFAVLGILKVRPYSSLVYYGRFWGLMTHQISFTTYQTSFDSLIQDNFKASQILLSDPDPYLFIWGTNPLLYAQSKKIPTGRFTVSFHIKDLQVYEETLQSIKLKKPRYIVLMDNERETWPEFNNYLAKNYVTSTYLSDFDHFEMWIKKDR